MNTTRNVLAFPKTHKVTSCEFIFLSSAERSGGVIYLHGSNSDDATSLTVESSLFDTCTLTAPKQRDCCGGAIYVDCGSSLSVTKSTFIGCTCNGFGGGIYCVGSCSSARVSFCTFISGFAMFGGGFMSYCGPSSSTSSSRFVSCSASASGGGLYHDSTENSPIFLTDSLFTRNIAYVVDPHTSGRAGGGMEDYRDYPYPSQYSFCFFCDNWTPPGYGNDVCVGGSLEQPFIHCFSATKASPRLLGGPSNENDWIPLSTDNSPFHV